MVDEAERVRNSSLAGEVRWQDVSLLFRADDTHRQANVTRYADEF